MAKIVDSIIEKIKGDVDALDYALGVTRISSRSLISEIDNRIINVLNAEELLFLEKNAEYISVYFRTLR